MSGHIEGDLRQKVPSLIRTDSWPVTLLISVRLTVIERNRNSWRLENFRNWNNYWYCTGWNHVLKSYGRGFLINHKLRQVSKYDGKIKTPTLNIPVTRVTINDWDNYITSTRGQSLGPNILVRLIYMLISFYFYPYLKEHSAFKR